MGHTAAFRRLIRLLQQARRQNLEAIGAPPVIANEPALNTRRHFLKKAGLAGAAGIAMTALPDPVRQLLASSGGPPQRVAIIGAGLAGLNAAHHLKKAGIRAEVYEASKRLGGRVLSRTGLVGHGLVTEMGGEFINTNHRDMLALAREFNLALFNRHEDAARHAIPKTGYYFAGKAWRETDLVKLLQPLVAQISADADRLDHNKEEYTPQFDRLSVSAYLDLHAALIRHPVVRALVENTIRTEYGVEPQLSSALQLLFLLPTIDGERLDLLGSSDEAYCVEGGNGRIIDALARGLDGQIRTGWSLNRIVKPDRGSYLLRFEHGEAIEADFVILAIPFTVLRQVKIEASLPAALRTFIREVNLGANEKVQAGYAKRLWRQSNGFVSEAWSDLGFSEVWEATQRQSNRQDAALTYFLGGREVTSPGNAGAKSKAGRVFTSKLSAFVPGLENVATGMYAGTGWSGNPFSRGAYTSFQPGQLSQFGEFMWVESDQPAEQQSVSVGRLVFAGEHLSDEFYGFMNGAAQTGRLAANAVIREMSLQANA